MKFFDLFKTNIAPKTTRDIAIDLGTANTVMYVKGEGIQVDEPTYVAINKKTEELEHIGEKAKEIIGRTAKHTEIIRPLKNGVISNYEVTERMLEEFLHRIKKDKFQSSRVIICVPSGVTQVERRAVIEVVKDAGAKEVYLIEEPIAAAIGVGIDLFEPKGHLIVDIGGGTTEIAFIVSGGAALSRSVKIAGDHLNEDIMEFVKDEYNLLIGERTAEELKINTISQDDPELEYEIRGRELGVGLPKSMKIKASAINGAITRHIDAIIDEVRLTIEEIEPEVAADIYETGIYLSGGGAGIKILKERIKELKTLKNKINKIWENFPITVKITLWYTAFIVILIAIMLTGSFTIADKMTGDLNQRELMESVVEMASEMVSNPDEFDDFDDGIYFVKYNNAGIEMAGMSPRGFDLTLNFAENTVRTYEKDGGKFYYFDKKINIPEGEWVRGIIPVNKLTNEVNRMLLIILISSPLLLLIIIYGGYKIIKKALNPVAKISDTASEIQKNGDFSKRIEIDEGKDEIHKMATAFNEMLNSLENSYIREKQFSSDVSHELRTPVSVILTESQYSLEYADTMEEAKDSFSVIQRQAKRMSELINQIMELSKIEKQTVIELQKINFSETVEKILEDCKNLLGKKNIKISKDIFLILFIYFFYFLLKLFISFFNIFT